MSIPKLDQIIETMVHGFAHTRSRTHPYLVMKVSKAFVLRDGPRRPSEDVRVSEIFSTETGVGEVLALSKSMANERHRVCIGHCGLDRNAEIEKQFKSNRFRYVAGEALFFSPTSKRPSGTPKWKVLRVTNEELEKAVSKASRRRPGDVQLLADDTKPDRQFVVMEDDRAVGWVTSIRTGDDFAWVSNLQVELEFRRRGIGRALMLALLKDDAARGIRFSVLAASKVGSTLYPQVGYKPCGLLQIFVPT